MAGKKLIKNCSCACLGLFLVSLSTLLMTQIYFNDSIISQISNTSILKDVRYPTWGINPNPTGSQYIQTFSLYNLDEIDGQIHSIKSNIQKSFEYTYQYQNVSFAQGNSGRLNYINAWELKQITANAPSSDNIKTINLAADKIFNYDFYAPPQRKFPILYNYITQTISQSFLQYFYTAYLHQYFFKNKQLVMSTVFQPLGFDSAKGEQIYDNQQYGWSNVDSFKVWVKLSLKGSKYSVKTSDYEDLVEQFDLSNQEISALLFEKSTINNMITALNGTIKSKLMMPANNNGYAYKCQQAYCTNKQLVASQMSGGFLTFDPLFNSLQLGKTIKQLNSTFLGQIQYRKYCEVTKDNCMSKTSVIDFFLKGKLGDFELFSDFWNKRNNYEAVEATFGIQKGKGKSVVGYVMYLYDQFIGQFQDTFSWAQTNYNNIEESIVAYKNLFLVELYSRAFYNKFILAKQVSCKDYFTGQFSAYLQNVCSSQSWNFVDSQESLRRVMKAYFFIQDMRNKMIQQVKIDEQLLISFFNHDQKSLLAAQVQQISSIFKKSFKCSPSSNELCKPEQIFCAQWGSNQIFQNLPIQIFSNKVKNINEWDSHKVLNGLNPDYYAIVGKKKNVEECAQILTSDHQNGIYSLFNILKMTKSAQSNQEHKDILKYIGRINIDIAFKGLINSQNISNLINGFTSPIVSKKKDLKISSGGAPWLQNNMKLIKTDNKMEIKNNQLAAIPQFDTIDTGIFNQDKTRQISKIWGESTSSSKYTIYQGTKTDSQGNQVFVDIFQKYITQRSVKGTNLLGFHPFIQQGQNLQIFFAQAHQSMNLVFDSEVTYESQNKKIKAYKYNIVLQSDKGSESFIGVEQLNQNFFQISQQAKSFAIVQPTTGLTLNLSISYEVKANPLFTKFLFDSEEKVKFYSSKIEYERRGLESISSINQQKSLKSTLFIVNIVVSGLIFVFTGVLFVLFKKSKGYQNEAEESLVQNEEETEYYVRS